LATIATIPNLKSTNSTITTLNTTFGTIGTLFASNGTVTNLLVTNGSISNVASVNNTTTNLHVTGTASIPNLISSFITTGNVLATNAFMTNVTIPNLNSTSIITNSAIALSGITSGNINIIGTEDSTSTSTGALVVRGGVGIQKSLNVAKKFNVSSPISGASSTSGQYINVTRSTFTDITASSGDTVPNMVFNAIERPIMSATNPIRVSDASTFYIQGGPTRGSNVTIGNSYGIYVGGNSYFDKITLGAGGINLETSLVYTYITDEKTLGTNGGTFDQNIWVTRDLNTIQSGGTNGGVSLSANQFTLDPGTYEIEASAPAYRCDGHKCRIYNISDSVVVNTGTTEFVTDSANTSLSRSSVRTYITITTPKTFELQHICGTTRLTDGLGIAVGLTTVETYSDVHIIKRV
jgi:hypothetical protein